MMADLPQFVLYSRTNSGIDPMEGRHLARPSWRFVLKARDGSLRMDVSDEEHVEARLKAQQLAKQLLK